MRGGVRKALVVALLAMPWLLVPGFGPTPAVLQACLAALVLVAWLWLGDARASHAVPSIALAWSIAAVANGAFAVAQFAALGDAEVHGWLRQRNQLATLLAMGLLSLCFLQTQAGRSRPWLLAAAVLVSVAAAFTSSRTATLHWVLVAGLAWWLVAGRSDAAPRRTALVALGAHLATLAALAATPWLHATTLLDRVDAAPACVSRLVLWRNALHLAGERFWTGWGLGEFDYAHYATPYPGERFCLIVDNAHNLPLHLAVELGVPAALVVVAGLAALVWRAKPWREQQPQRRWCWGILLLVGVHSLVEFPLWYGPFQLAVALCVLCLVRARGEPRSATRSRRARQIFGTTAAALLLAGVAWDYLRVTQLYLPPESRVAAYRVQPLAQARGSVLFRQQVDFAEFTTAPLTATNAAALATVGERALHYSPEPRVIGKLIDAHRLAGDEARARWHDERFEAAFPQARAAWLGGRGGPARPLP